MMTIALTVAATLASIVMPAVLGNIQYDTSYMARWAFFLWWGTFTAGLWAAAVWSTHT